MNNEENIQGNPEAVDNAVLGSEGDDFFSALEDSVNSMVQEPEKPEAKTEVTPDNQGSNQTAETEASVSQGSEDPELDNLKKRYSDSSREAQNLRAQLNELKPFVPVLDAMKKDSGLVEHMRTYLKNGGDVPGNIKEQLKLGEDFEFDVDDMVSDPKSDSAKVFQSMVGNVVNKKANQILATEEQKAVETRQKIQYQQQAGDFMQERGMNEEEFLSFVDQAKEKMGNSLSLNDMYHLVNRDEVNKNVATNTKEDMLKQMKGVRNMPTSQANVNNAGTADKSTHDKMFEALLDFDSGVDNMFG